MDISSIPLVSICCVTYNHENYIKQCLDGFVMQQTNFQFEILVHEDASTDNTALVLKEYEANYPHLFRCVYQQENQFLKQNVLHSIIFPMARGKYIAMCEGDDYWTNEYKLQKQIDFLEANPEYSGCFHNAEERYEDDPLKASFLYCDFPAARDITFKDLSYKNPIPTCSVIFKKGLYGSVPTWLETLPMGDWPLHLLNAQYGNFWYIPKVMCVHRLHSKGMWGLQDQQKSWQLTVDAYDKMIEGFASNREFQQQLEIGRKKFIGLAPQQVSVLRRGINLLRRIKNGVG